jgi:hypothetical protein
MEDNKLSVTAGPNAGDIVSETFVQTHPLEWSKVTNVGDQGEYGLYVAGDSENRAYYWHRPDTRNRWQRFRDEVRHRIGGAWLALKGYYD